jgi:hypothetical protein
MPDWQDCNSTFDNAKRTHGKGHEIARPARRALDEYGMLLSQQLWFQEQDALITLLNGGFNLFFERLYWRGCINY